MVWLGAMCVCVWVQSCFSRVWLFCTLACQIPLSTGFSRQEYWSGMQCLPPGDLPDPEIEPESLTSPALAGRFFTTSATWEALGAMYLWVNVKVLHRETRMHWDTQEVKFPQKISSHTRITKHVRKSSVMKNSQKTQVHCI